MRDVEGKPGVRSVNRAGRVHVQRAFAAALIVGSVWSAAAQAGQGRGAQAPAGGAAPAAQGGRGAAPAAPTPPATGRSGAPFDMTGYWTAVVTEDWRWRMVTPPKGDYASVPLNMAAKKVGDAWDPAKDEAAGDACKGYGAPGLMRQPTRLNITWQDDNTLKVDADAGTQTRLLHFGDWKPADGSQPSRQGDTTAQWETPPAGRGAAPAPPRFGNLKTVTTRLLPGYLRKNGLPYSGDKTTLTEYWDLLRQADGSQWLVITTVVEDPTYLTRTWITSLNFKKEPNGSKWDPSPCTAR
jgi:hypothetical protein